MENSYQRCTVNTVRNNPTQVRYLVEEILKVCGDRRSARFYGQVATALPDEAIFRFLSEIRQDETIKNRGAVFTTKAKDYLDRHSKNGVGH